MATWGWFAIGLALGTLLAFGLFCLCAANGLSYDREKARKLKLEVETLEESNGRLVIELAERTAERDMEKQKRVWVENRLKYHKVMDGQGGYSTKGD